MHPLFHEKRLHWAVKWTSVSPCIEDGKLAYRHPPPVNWGMLVDFAHVLTDPDYVRWQVSGRGSLSSPLQLNLSRFGHTAPCPPV